MTGIRSSNVSFSYKSRQVLDNVSFQVPLGEITYLAGENGSGKTTWIKIATCLLGAKAGNVTYDNKAFSHIRDRFGIVFDIPAIYPKLNGYDNLFILYNIDGKELGNAELLMTLGFDTYMLSMKAGEYSLGQRHRFAIAAALLRNPDFLILDEPDLGLDPKSWDLVSDKLQKLKNKGTAILITGQNFEVLDGIIDRIVVLNNRTIVYEGNSDDFKMNSNLSNASLKQAFEKAIGE